MSRTELRGINKYCGKNYVLKDISLVIEDGEFMTLLGPSDCGKTTTLHMVTGLEEPQKGYMHMRDREIVNAPEKFYEEPGKRHLNLVSQSYALWPHTTVFNNMTFSLKVAEVPKEEIRKKVENTLERIGIEVLINRYPSELSSGQQQRVAIARAIMSEPEMLLLDEPLSSLDAKLRIEMRSEVKRLHQELGATIICVTYDQTETLTMSTKIAILFGGVLGQMAPPMKLYQDPASLRVADFISDPKVSFLPDKARISGDTMTVEPILGTVTFDKKSFTGGAPGDGSFEAVVGVRPELVGILDRPVKGGIGTEVYFVMPADSETIIYLEAGGGRILSRQSGFKQYSPNQKVWLRVNPDKMNVFSEDNGKLARLTVMDAQEDE